MQFGSKKSMSQVTEIIAQYGRLWEFAVIEAGKRDCTPSLVLQGSIRYYNTLLKKKNKTMEEDKYINDHKKLYTNLKTPKLWRSLTTEEKLVFCVDAMFNQAIKLPYILPPSNRKENFLDISIRTHNFGDYIIKAKDDQGNESPLRSLASFECCAFTLQLDNQLINNIKTRSNSKYADYIRRNILNKAIKKLNEQFNKQVDCLFIVEKNHTTSSALHLHGVLGITAEELSVTSKKKRSKRKAVKSILLECALGKDYDKHPLVKTAVKISIIHHPLGWANYISKNIAFRKEAYISKEALQKGKLLYDEYRKEVKDLNNVLHNLK